MYRILHISSARSWRGGEQQIAYLIDGLRKHNVESYVLCPKEAPLLQKIKLKIKQAFTFTKKRSFDYTVSKLIYEICTNHNINGIHIHDSHSHNYLWTSYLFYTLRTPSVVSRRVDFPIKKLSVLKYNHPQIKKVICISNAIKNILSPNIKNKERITTIYSGIELKSKNTESYLLKKSYNLDPSKKVVAMVAAIAPHKDYSTFVKTAVEFEKKNRNQTTFLIIGQDAGEEAKIRNLIHQSNAKSYIKVVGHLENANRKMHDIDIFMMTSKEEGLCTSILDAMHNGIPVIATRAGGIPELVQHEVNGLLANIGDYHTLSQHIETLLDDPIRCNSLILKAKEHLVAFSKEEMAAQNFKVYQNCFN